VKSGALETQHTLTESLHKATAASHSLFAFQRSSFETMMHAGKIYAEGLRTLATEAAQAQRAHMEATMATMRSLASTRSVNEAMRLQTEHARATTTRAMTETTKLVQDYLKLAEQATAPITAKVQEAVEKFSKAA
jgi:hypothetical protein